MTSDLELTVGVGWAPAGVPPGGDPTMTKAAVVAATDPTRNRIQVSVDGGDPTWLPGLPGLYRIGQTVWVLRNPITASPLLCLGPTLGYPPVVAGVLTGQNTTTIRATVTLPDGTVTTVPYIAGGYTVGGQVWVALDPTTFGTPYLVLGPAALPPVPPPPPAPPVPPPPPAPTTVAVSALVVPTWSGSWRAAVGAYGRWNVGTNGADALWQGNAYGSGPMTGVATYGNRVTNLGALSIEGITVTLRGAGVSAASWPPITVQGVTSGTPPVGAPSPGGDTATGSPGARGVAHPSLTPAMCEAFRTGGVRALALVGGGYGAVRGTSASDGMVLRINYTRPA